MLLINGLIVSWPLLGAAAEVAEGLLVQLGPGFLRRVPDHPAEAAARVAQGHHEQAWTAVAVTARYARERPFAVVDLGFLAGGELQPVELLRLAPDNSAAN